MINNWETLVSSIEVSSGGSNKNSEYINVYNEISNLSSEKLTQIFPKLFTRQGKIKRLQIKIEFKKDAEITHQKGRLVPLQLQEAVEQEMNKLLAKGRIRRVENVSGEVFIQPVVIRVKKDKNVKIALDATSWNNATQKENKRMPNVDNLMDQVAELIQMEKEQ